MLKIKDDFPLEKLKDYGFEEYNDSYNRDYHNDYLTEIDKQTREIFKVDYEWKFLENKYYRNSTYKIKDLIDLGIVEKVEEE